MPCDMEKPSVILCQSKTSVTGNSKAWDLPASWETNMTTRASPAAIALVGRSVSFIALDVCVKYDGTYTRPSKNAAPTASFRPTDICSRQI